MIPLKLKGGVSLLGMHPQLVVALFAANPIWKAYGAPSLVITSCTDGEHSRNSLHYAGTAFDLRTRDLPGGSTGQAANSCQADLSHALGKDFDVVLESTHIHVEWQPEGN